MRLNPRRERRCDQYPQRQLVQRHPVGLSTPGPASATSFGGHRANGANYAAGGRTRGLLRPSQLEGPGGTARNRGRQGSPGRDLRPGLDVRAVQAGYLSGPETRWREDQTDRTQKVGVSSRSRHCLRLGGQVGGTPTRIGQADRSRLKNVR